MKNSSVNLGLLILRLCFSISLMTHGYGKFLKLINTTNAEGEGLKLSYLERIIGETDKIFGFIELDVKSKNHYFVWKFKDNNWFKIDSELDSKYNGYSYPEWGKTLDFLAKYYGMITQEDPKINEKNDTK